MKFDNLIHSLRSEDRRNKIVTNNILRSALYKCIGLACTFITVPITISYLDNEVYGIWMTMSSILYWFYYFDVGLGNGMRNYLAESISLGDYDKAKTYISTTFVILSIVALGLGVLVVGAMTFINLNAVFNTNTITGSDLYVAMLLACIMTLVLIVVKNVGVVFMAMQRYAINDMLVALGSVVALGIIYVLTLTTEGHMLYVVAAFTISPVVVFIVAAIPLFCKHRELRPSMHYVDKSIAIRVVSKGFGFFLIQITMGLVIFGCANVFISQFCGPTNVTVYNIAYRYFHLMAAVFTIILSPIWNAYTDAYVKDNIDWIRTTFTRTLKTWLLSIVGGGVMLALSNIIYSIWVGGLVEVPWGVSLTTLLYVTAFNLNNCAIYLLNGLNKIHIQICTSIIFTLLFLLIMLIGNKRLGITGVVGSMAMCTAIMSLIHCYQCRLIINKKAKGIWNK